MDGFEIDVWFIEYGGSKKRAGLTTNTRLQAEKPLMRSTTHFCRQAGSVILVNNSTCDLDWSPRDQTSVQWDSVTSCNSRTSTITASISNGSPPDKTDDTDIKVLPAQIAIAEDASYAMAWRRYGSTALTAFGIPLYGRTVSIAVEETATPAKACLDGHLGAGQQWRSVYHQSNKRSQLLFHCLFPKKNQQQLGRTCLALSDSGRHNAVNK